MPTFTHKPLKISAWRCIDLINMWWNAPQDLNKHLTPADVRQLVFHYRSMSIQGQLGSPDMLGMAEDWLVKDRNGLLFFVGDKTFQDRYEAVKETE